MLYYNQTTDDVLRYLKTKNDTGLSSHEAKKRLDKFGANTLTVKRTSFFRKVIEPFLDVFTVVLIIAAILSFLQKNFIDGTLVLIIIAVNSTIYYAQQLSTERILKSLKRQTTQKVYTLRDGKREIIDATSLVPGDIIFLAEGDKVPADSRIISESNVTTDESLLTGEATPVKKTGYKLSANKEIYEQSNMLFSGTFITSGEVTSVVTETGNETEYGRIADLATSVDNLSPIQVKINNLVSKIIIAVAAIAVLVFFLSLFNGSSLVDSLQFTIALAVSAVPEGLPIAISVILALGVRRIAKKKALVTHMRAIETLGAVTVIATDKTGTLTENHLKVQDSWQLPGTKTNLTKYAALSALGNKTSHDPLDKSMLEYVKLSGEMFMELEPLEVLAFDQGSTMSGNIWNDGDGYLLAIKGAPEVIIDSSKLTENEQELCINTVNQFAGKGYRVIALADLKTKKRITKIGKLSGKDKLNFIGLLAIADTIRHESPSSIKAAKQAGIKVKMITGDHFETAYQVGKKLGLVTERDQVFDCRKMDLLGDEELEEIVNKSGVFSRVTPDVKFRILSILNKTEITAMTGDGVNDVPALANAHVGIAMGSGSAITKDASDIILLDNNFKNILNAVKEGRVIISNIKRMLFYLLSTNAGEALTLVGALIIGSKAPLLPVQILWINLVTDSLAVVPLGLESAESNLMRQKPQKPDSPILDKVQITRIALVAILMAINTLIVYRHFEPILGHDAASTLAFTALVAIQWANALNARSSDQSLLKRLRTPNYKLYACLIIAIILQLIVLFGPLQSILHITPVPMKDIAVVSLISFIAPIILVEIHKLIVSKTSGKSVI